MDLDSSLMATLLNLYKMYYFLQKVEEVCPLLSVLFLLIDYNTAIVHMFLSSVKGQHYTAIKKFRHKLQPYQLVKKKPP